MSERYDIPIEIVGVPYQYIKSAGEGNIAALSAVAYVDEQKRNQGGINMARVIGSSEFESEVKEGVVIVDFFATWCEPCKMLAPIFEELGTEMEGKAKFLKVDVDQSKDIASKYGVSTIPTLLLIKDGEKEDIIVGFSPKQVIEAKIKKYL